MSEDASTIQAAEAKPSVSPSASSQPVMSPETAVPDTSNQETPRVTAPNATLTPIPFQADKGHKLDQAATTKTASENVPASLHALARFEFEPGKGNEGTKILMVEWEDTDTRRLHVHGGSWSVEWEGKRAVMTGTSSAKDDVKDNAEPQTNDDTRRFYFMLPPGATIPPVITLKYTPPPATSLQAQGTTFSAIKVGSHHPEAAQVTVNPLPAIYPPSLGVTARSAGKKGVLHTLWAKKRLRSLAKEIQEEEQYNLEGIALEMARTERAWILENFGVTEARVENREVREQMVDYPTTPLPSLKNPGSPTSPRLTEKLRGLKLGTSDKVLAGGKDGSSLRSLRQKLHTYRESWLIKQKQVSHTSAYLTTILCRQKHLTSPSHLSARSAIHQFPLPKHPLPQPFQTHHLFSLPAANTLLPPPRTSMSSASPL